MLSGARKNLWEEERFVVKPPVPTGRLAALRVSPAFDYLWHLWKSHWCVDLICITMDLCYQTNKSLS